jgi:hypothetical protein
MKKADLTVGEEYAYSRSRDWERFRYGELPRQVRLLGFRDGNHVDLEWLDGREPGVWTNEHATTRCLVAPWSEAKRLIDHEMRWRKDEARRLEESRELAQRIRAWADRRNLDTYGLTAGGNVLTVPTALLTALADAANA